MKKALAVIGGGILVVILVFGAIKVMLWGYDLQGNIIADRVIEHMIETEVE